MTTAFTHTSQPKVWAPPTVEPLTDEDRRRLEDVEEEPRLVQKPASGKTSALGRRVEKPGEGKAGGPSGQTDEARHDRRHTNK